MASVRARVEELGRRFLERHRLLYGFATDEPWELVALRMRVWVPRRDSVAAAAADAVEPRPQSVDRCAFDRAGARDTPRLDRSGLVAGRPVQGPAIVEDMFSTVVVPPGATLTPDRDGHLFIAVAMSLCLWLSIALGIWLSLNGR